ncbi:MAG: zinc ABC transporter substrate-binding protein [Actinobacteria bacterium]|nr:MAG: zinc ABC transporter substrate-binding protein [Actinomycetota bacterium]
MLSRIVLILIVAGLVGCSPAAAGPNTVVAAFYPLAFAAQTMSPSAKVENLTPPGAEPHDLELTPRAVGRIETAGVVLYLSHGFQPAVSDAVKSAKGRAVDILQGLPLHSAHAQEAGLTADPHVWLDPVLFQRIVRRIAGALPKPAHTADLIAELRKLHRDYRRGLADCARKDIVTSHAAFGYLAQRYGLHQVPITGLTPESEPTPKQLAHVVTLVRRTHATTVFFERLVSPRLAETVAREVGARTAVLDPIEGLTPPEQAHGENYLTLMRENLAALRKALTCR